MLKKGLVYRRYGTDVYAKDISGHKDFIFNETVGDILDFYSENPDAQIDDLTQHMENLYNTSGLRDDMQEFVEYLQSQGLLVEDADEKEEKGSDAIHDQMLECSMKHHILNTVSLELTYRCSERCIHCYIDGDSNSMQSMELSPDDYKSILDELREMGCMSVLLTGGEVCLYKDFIAVAEYAVSKGFLVDVYTNGISMSDEQFDRLVGMGLNTVSFSLYGGTPEVHDAISGVKGSFRKTVERMMMFKCAGVDTYIKGVVMKQNENDIEQLMKLGKRLKIGVQLSYMIIPSHNGISPETLRLYDTEKYYRVMETEYLYQPYELKSAEKNAEDPICGCGKYMLSIDPYGNVYPCVSTKINLGNVKDMSIAEIWNNSDKLKRIAGVKVKDMECKVQDCEHRGLCNICLGGVYDKQRDAFVPTAENCAIAEASTKLCAAYGKNK